LDNLLALAELVRGNLFRDIKAEVDKNQIAAFKRTGKHTPFPAVQGGDV
jgi:hypothetical protein